jgi:hypothetical protein
MIEVILDKTFINNFGDITSDIGRSIDKILLNENNVFIINTSLLEYVEEHINIDYKDKWESYFTYLSDNNHLISSNTNTLNSDIIFDEAPYQHDYRIILTNNDIDNINTCNLSINTINNTLFKGLLENGMCTFRNTNFNTNDEIKLIFEKLFYCSKTIHRIIIISRYNHFDCDIINILKNKFNKKSFWTTYKGPNDPSTNLRLLRQQLGNSLLLFTGDKEQIHERKLIIGTLIVEFDDDFNKITHDYSTWMCHCSVNKDLANTLRSKQSSLKRIS